MGVNLEELDYQRTPIGELILRRRRFPILGDTDVFEVILNDEFLMSSLFTAGEIALADIGLQHAAAAKLDIIVGGLGLGYTAGAALADPRVRSMTVIEALPAVIAWHRSGLLPLGKQLAGDARCTLFEGSFFELAGDNFRMLDPAPGDRRFHAVLLDIDHSPQHVLHPRNRAFYSVAGLTRLRACLHEAGVFALWSNDPPDQEFMSVLAEVFATCSAHVVPIDNPLTGAAGSNTIYHAQV
jgi:spermidine synthase